MHSIMPSIFLAHGSPFLLDDDRWVGELAKWALALPRPKAILVISAHWVVRPVTLGATRTMPLVYDFYGFPRKYYAVTYPAPGAPALAQRVRECLSPSRPVASDESRGLDHGAYVPLVAMYPAADVPVVQLSIPTMDPRELLEVGRALAPLRREGYLLVGSGFLTHNLHVVDWAPEAKTPAWAREFDDWIKDVLARRDVEAFVRYRERAPGVQTALPTHEHFVPVAISLGSSMDLPEERTTFPIEGFAYGAFTKRSVQFG
jgi:4,5-DOPA dioxygenase extradiol